MDNNIDMTNEQAAAVIRNLFHNSPFFMINKHLLKHLNKNWEVMALLTELLDKEGMFVQKDIIQKEGDSFYHLEKYIEESTGLSPHKQRACLDILKEKQIIFVERKGLPAKKYYSINHKELIRIFSIVEKDKNLISRSLNFKYLNNKNINIEVNNTDVDLKNFKIYNNKNENINIDTSFLSKDKKEEQFSPSERICLLSSPKDPPPHKLNRRSLTKSKKIRSLSIIKKYQEVPIKQIRVSPPIRELLEHWVELKLYLPKENTKAFIDSVNKLRRLLSGSLFNQKFTTDEIKISMDRFALSALDMDFEPSKPAYKKILSKMTPSTFIENNYTTGEKSFFLKFMKQEPQPSRNVEKELLDNHPTITKKLINIYREKVLSNIKVEFNTKERNCFIKSSERIVKFFKDNSKQINHYAMPTNEEKAQYLWEALIADVGGGGENIRKITPGWFCSDTTFHYRYPAYLTQQGVLFFEEDTDSFYKIPTQENTDPFGLYDLK